MEYGELTIIDHGVEVVGESEYILCSLQLIAQGDERFMKVGGDQVTFGSPGKGVTYNVTGWDQEHSCLILRKGI